MAASPNQSRPPAPPPVSADHALFLDLDGTLLEIAEQPGDVRLPNGLHATLRSLAGGLGGALALVSGRPIADLDHLLDPLRLPAAGQHGLEWRGADGTISHTGHTVPPEAVDEVAAFERQHAGTMLERKTASLALHYRGRPEAGHAATALLNDLAADLAGDWEVLHGKMVVELRPRGIHKGIGIQRLLAAPPFAGRVPVFAGDDWTDEDGFATVNELGGTSVVVGTTRASRARYVLRDVPAVHAWLAHSLDALAPTETR